MLWEIELTPRPGWPNNEAERIRQGVIDLGLPPLPTLRAARGFLVEGELEQADMERAAREIFVDLVVDSAQIRSLPHSEEASAAGRARIAHVLPKPGVTDPVAETALRAVVDLGLRARRVSTFRRYWFEAIPDTTWRVLRQRLLCNESVERLIEGPLEIRSLELGSDYVFRRIEVPLRGLDDAALMGISREWTLALNREEMRTIQAFYREQGREPTDIELETIAQTWSEHCSHKTLAGSIRYEDERGARLFKNMLKETIFAATVEIRAALGGDDWCVSVFEDNAGIVTFERDYHVAFKVETHNHPSAIEPYGGANTGLGGVIRDILGTGLGAKPVCGTDIFCFAPPDTPMEDLPPGVLHPRRVMRGVVAGVRDYGNRMGIPTVNGAIYFDPRYLGNPLVYCGNVGLIPVNRVDKAPRAEDWIVTLGGRTGRDGIHGATFSSIELTHESETLSGGAVQIGNAITEKMVLDVLLAARDRGLYSAVTDCGAGGFSSAVGELGARLGAEVWLDQAPLKYAGLSYAEIWISEAQERMVLAVPPSCWDEFHQLCAAEGVEATILGKFVPTGELRLMYAGQEVGVLPMKFLHGGRPPVVREARYTPVPRPVEAPRLPADIDCGETLRRILASPNVASKEWVIRQYDHEVQGGSVIKPLGGAGDDGPNNAAVLRPVLGSNRGLVIACGMHPRLGDWDPYWMAASAIDEAVRNCVAVGADPARIAILDNFCWGNTDRPETLGSLVRAALACHDVAIAWKTPFISGKDSLNNEFSFVDHRGERVTIAIPPSLLISALGQVEDVRQCVSMDLKGIGNALFLVGTTKAEFAGSQLALVLGLADLGGIPTVNLATARKTFTKLHFAIREGLVRACHDLSDGGLGVALAEMALAGNCGADVELSLVPWASEEAAPTAAALLFAESNSRFLCEVAPADIGRFNEILQGVPAACIGHVTPARRLRVHAPGGGPQPAIDADLLALKQAWQGFLAAW